MYVYILLYLWHSTIIVLVYVAADISLYIHMHVNTRYTCIRYSPLWSRVYLCVFKYNVTIYMYSCRYRDNIHVWGDKTKSGDNHHNISQILLCISTTMYMYITCTCMHVHVNVLYMYNVMYIIIYNTVHVWYDTHDCIQCTWTCIYCTYNMYV